MLATTVLAGRGELFLLLRAFAAASDQEVRAVVRDRYGALYRMVTATSGAGAEGLHQFFANEMLLTAAAAITPHRDGLDGIGRRIFSKEGEVRWRRLSQVASRP